MISLRDSIMLHFPIEVFEMATSCDRCKGILIPKFNKAVTGSIAAAILWCGVYEKDGHCPYLPDHHHTPREVIMPPQFSSTFIVAASSGEYWDHESIMARYDDPEIEGYIIHLFEWE